MHVLLFHNAGGSSPYYTWLKQVIPDCTTTVLAESEDVKTLAGMQEIDSVVEVDDLALVDVKTVIDRLSHRPPVDRVFSNSERDVELAAELREAFDLPGMRPGLARQFRDKVAMKDLFADIDVPFIEFAPFAGTGDVRRRLERWGSVVIKPRRASGSRGVVVAHEFADVPTISEENHRHYMIERFAPGRVFHVDAAIVRGAVRAVATSEYLDPPHLYGSRNVGSFMLDRDSVEARTGARAAERLAASLGHDSGLAVLHLEFIEDADAVMRAGEVACRVGGGLIRPGFHHTHGLDLSRHALLSEVGASTGEGRHRSPTGFLLETGGPRLREGSSDWVVMDDRIEERNLTSSTAATRRILVEGKDQAELKLRLAHLGGNK